MDANAATTLRSQLNQIAAASQMLEATAAGRSRSYLAVINQGVCRMLRVVGRMELEQRLSETSPQPVPTDLSLLLEDLGRRMESILACAGVHFSFACPAALHVHIDGELLQQLLLELITHLALTAAEIRMTVTVQGTHLHFTVSDSGPGNTEGRSVLPGALEAREEDTSLKFARRLSELLGGTLMVSPGTNRSLSLAVSVPLTEELRSARLESPRTVWSGGGFDPALVALSELLPAAAFLPENLD